MELLKKLYETYSPSEGEKKMVKFIKSWITENVPDAICYKESKNLYVVKGESVTYPCMVAHMDQVQHIHSKDFRAHMIGDTILGFSEKNKRQEGLGADDKNGIWVALKCLQKYDVFKCAFFMGEEIGCVGSSKADMTFFTDCRFVLECDRRGNSDFITHISSTELCSKEFLNDAEISTFGYKENRGMMTDVLELKENGLDVSCVNISCGYYNPHTDHETTSWSDLNNCLALCEHIIENCVEVYPHKHKNSYGFNSFNEPYIGQKGSYGDYGAFYDYDDLYDYDELYDLMFTYIYDEYTNHGYYPSSDDVMYEFKGFAERESIKQIYEYALYDVKYHCTVSECEEDIKKS